MEFKTSLKALGTFILLTSATAWSQSSPFKGTPQLIPGTIQVEKFDVGGEGVAYHDSTPNNEGGSFRGKEGVDIEKLSPGGNAVISAHPGEWMKYTVNVTAGTYVLHANVASASAGKSFRVEIDGTTVATIQVPNTGDSLVFQNVVVKNIQLSAGTKVVRIYDITDGFSINYIRFTVPSANQQVPFSDIPGMIPGKAPASPVTGKLQVWKRNIDGIWPSFNNYDAVVYLPADYLSRPNKKYPLVISLHGKGGSVLTTDHSAPGGNREGFIKQVWDGSPLQSTYQGIVIAPNGAPKGVNQDTWWNVDFTAQLIVDATKYFRVDMNKIVATGLSAGGGGVDDLMNKYLYMLAGASPVAFFPPNNNAMTAANTCPFVGLPIWAAGNSCDGTFSYYNWQTQFQATLSKCAGYNPNLLTITAVAQTCDHGGWDEFYSRPDAQSWMIQQSK